MYKSAFQRKSKSNIALFERVAMGSYETDFLVHASLLFTAGELVLKHNKRGAPWDPKRQYILHGTECLRTPIRMVN
jgi:hypothetical protein